MTTVITLNDTIREAARRNPASLLTVIGMYASTGRVNDISIEQLDEAVNHALDGGRNKPMPVREQFENDQSFNDQHNQQTIIRALSTTLCYGFTADNIPSMIDEMYDRMESHEELWGAYTAISESTRRMEEAFMDKAKTELF
ncbi:hypothetical protein pEaSNUABM10_00150 [Erwinia phage pEa_SNUABM_10]|nr:hypothetical protein pEaSNUABM10_00150 [Erwinia phage pEa_SNUABM_10]